MSEQELIERARKIKLLIFDVDGVLTDGSLFYGDDGQEYKSFHSRDGHGIKMLKATGVEAGILTGRTSNVVLHRARNLGIGHIFQGADDKLAVYQRLLAETGLQPEQTGYMGDDVVDLPVLKRCGLALSVPEAHPLVAGQVHYITQAHAGRGAAREACELIMRAQGTWDAQMAHFNR